MSSVGEEMFVFFIQEPNKGNFAWMDFAVEKQTGRCQFTSR